MRQLMWMIVGVSGIGCLAVGTEDGDPAESTIEALDIPCPGTGEPGTHVDPSTLEPAWFAYGPERVSDIRIDGERWEGAVVDERMVVQLSTGRHVIQIESQGYRRYTTEVTVRSGETSALNVALTKQ